MMNQDVYLDEQIDALIDGDATLDELRLHDLWEQGWGPSNQATLAELFEMNDEVGDKYLSEQEIAARDIALANARERAAASFEQWSAELLSDLLLND